MTVNPSILKAALVAEEAEILGVTLPRRLFEQLRAEGASAGDEI